MDIMNVKFSENVLVLNGNFIHCDLFDLGADGAVYLPVDVINTFFDGIMISYDTEEKSLLVQCEELCYIKVRKPQTTPKIDKVQIP